MNEKIESPRKVYDPVDFPEAVRIVSDSANVGMSVCSIPSESAAREAFSVFQMIQKDFLGLLPESEYGEPGEGSLVARAAKPFKRVWKFEEVEILNVHEGWPSDDNSDFVIRLKSRPSLLVFFDGCEGLWITITSTPFHVTDKATVLLYHYSPHETIQVRGCGPHDFARTE